MSLKSTKLPMVGEVTIERHPLNTQLAPQSPHRQRRQPFPIHELNRGVHDPLLAELPAGSRHGKHSALRFRI